MNFIISLFALLVKIILFVILIVFLYYLFNPYSPNTKYLLSYLQNTLKNLKEIFGYKTNKHKQILNYLAASDTDVIAVTNDTTLINIPKHRLAKVWFFTDQSEETKMDEATEVSLIKGSIFRQSAISQIILSSNFKTKNNDHGYLILDGCLVKSEPEKNYALNKYSVTTEITGSTTSTKTNDEINYSKLNGLFLALYENLVFVSMLEKLTKNFSNIETDDPLVGVYRAIKNMGALNNDLIFVILPNTYRAETKALMEELTEFMNVTYVFLDEYVMRMKYQSAMILVADNNFKMNCIQKPLAISSAGFLLENKAKIHTINQASYYLEGIKSVTICKSTMEDQKPLTH